MKIYISIPITGCDIDTQRTKAAEIADKIRALGHKPVNPFDTPQPPAGLSDKERYAYFMGEDIKRLIMCDAIYMSAGWTKSKGCKAEYEVAGCYNLTRFRNLAIIPIAADRIPDFDKATF